MPVAYVSLRSASSHSFFLQLTQQYPGQGTMNAGGMMINVGSNQQVGIPQGL